MLLDQPYFTFSHPFHWQSCSLNGVTVNPQGTRLIQGALWQPQITYMLETQLCAPFTVLARISPQEILVRDAQETLWLIDMAMVPKRVLQHVDLFTAAQSLATSGDFYFLLVGREVVTLDRHRLDILHRVPVETGDQMITFEESLIIKHGGSQGGNLEWDHYWLLKGLPLVGTKSRLRAQGPHIGPLGQDAHQGYVVCDFEKLTIEWRGPDFIRAYPLPIALRDMLASGVDPSLYPLNQEEALIQAGESLWLCSSQGPVTPFNWPLPMGNLWFYSGGRIQFLSQDSLIVQQFVTLNTLHDYAEEGHLLTPILDSGELLNPWMKLNLIFDLPADTYIGVFVRLSDSKAPEHFENLDFQLVGMNRRELALTAFKGRYLQIKLVLRGLKHISPEVKSLRVYYRLNSLIHYLPEVYSEFDGQADGQAGFGERLLTLYQSMLMGHEEAMANATFHFDPRTVAPEHLAWLSSWLGFSEGFQWPAHTLRGLLERGASLYARRGTLRGFVDMVEAFSGGKCYVVGYHDIVDEGVDAHQREGYFQRYTDHPYRMCAMIQHSEFISRQFKGDIERFVAYQAPANLAIDVVFLEQFAILDHHTYLGINARLVNPSHGQLDRHAVMPYQTVLK